MYNFWPELRHHPMVFELSNFSYPLIKLLHRANASSCIGKGKNFISSPGGVAQSSSHFPKERELRVRFPLGF
jgi:hypothetical protein